MANSIIQSIVMIALPMALVFTISLIIILAVYVFFYVQKSKPRDALRELFKDMVDLAIINYEPHMIDLYRTPSEKSTEGGFPVVYKGNIIGYNRINLYTSFEELYQPEKSKEGQYFFTLGKKEFIIPEEEINAVKNLINEAGDFLNVIVYEIDHGWKIPFLIKNKEVNAVLCFDDQVTGLSSIDGKVILHAPGTESHGCYFEIPSGSRDRTKVVMGVIETLTWIRMNSISLGNIFNLSDQALSINPAFNQLLTLRTVEQPTAKIDTK